ncbi:MAG TPA: S-layer homology domain-containing protein, partial [Anaerolineales bacterium]|nr:S-layer homology domain-containing protein [Anaerolineales bacterium]
MFTKNRLFLWIRLILGFIFAVSLLNGTFEKVSAGPVVGSISGVVYQADGTTPLENVYVLASGAPNYSFWYCTNALGEYTLSGLPFGVEFKVEASPTWVNCGIWGNYVEEFWPNSMDAEHADSVLLDAFNPDRTGINFTLDPGGVISGTVYKADGVTPIKNIAVSFASGDTDYGSICTAVNGQYAFHGVPLNTPMRIQTHSYHDSWCNADADYVPEYWQTTLDNGPTLLTVPTPSSPINGIDFNLELKGGQAIPSLGVWYLDDYIEVMNWPTGAHVKLFIDDPVTVVSPDFTDQMSLTGSDGYFDTSGAFDIKPGMIVIVSGNYISNVVVVRNVTITEVNQVTDTITGTAPANDWLWMYFADSCCRATTTSPDGVWEIDYQVTGPKGESIADINSDSSGAIHDPSGDGRTSVEWIAALPAVESIQRAASNPSAEASLNFTVTFSKSVTGVDVHDFTLTTSGISGAALQNVSGSGKTYTVSVTTGDGNGTIRLDMPVNANITDMDLRPLMGLPYTNGQSYSIIREQTFEDTPPTYWASQYIERLYISGITGGCGNGNYCPTDPVTRAQMAVFLLKGIHGSSFAPPTVGGSTGFSDVDVSHWAAA